jgi:cytochrome c biogenesis protein
MNSALNPRGRLYRISAHAGSLRATLMLLALLAAVMFARPAFAPLAAVMALLALNLAAAIVVHPAFRRQLPLLAAHLALLLLVLGVGLGKLFALDGRFELTLGVPFDGELLDRDAGHLYRERLRGLAFEHGGFEIDYAPGRQRGATRNLVRFTDAEGRIREAVIGDHRPLVLEGHRFYTTPNKGFAPVLRWEGGGGAGQSGGEAVRGAVHLPSFPAHELRQWREWQLAGSGTVWVMLQIEGALIDPRTATRFEMPREHRLVVRQGERRFELRPGEAAELAGGRLVYEELRTWMGYRVAYDPTLPWLLASALLAALAFGWHYLARFAAGAARAAPAPAALAAPAATAATTTTAAATVTTATPAGAARLRQAEFADG